MTDDNDIQWDHDQPPDELNAEVLRDRLGVGDLNDDVVYAVLTHMLELARQADAELLDRFLRAAATTYAKPQGDRVMFALVFDDVSPAMAQARAPEGREPSSPEAEGLDMDSVLPRGKVPGGELVVGPPQG
jgi:hypothetical protein